MALIATKYAQSIDDKIDSSDGNLETLDVATVFSGAVDPIASQFAG